MARVTLAVGEAVWVFVVSKLRWPRCAVGPNLHLHRQSTPSSAIYLSRAYLNVPDCVTHERPIPMECNDIPRDIPERDPPRTYVRTYVLGENRSSIQSLALMRSAITPLEYYKWRYRPRTLQNLDCGLWTGPWTGLWTQ